jgi:hypothetical protein
MPAFLPGQGRAKKHFNEQLFFRGIVACEEINAGHAGKIAIARGNGQWKGVEKKRGKWVFYIILSLVPSVVRQLKLNQAVN